MTMQELLRCDLSLPFQDWGETVEYNVVLRVLDVETQQVEETVVATSLQGLVGTMSAERMETVAGQATGSGREVLVRSRDLPEDAPQLTDRLKIGEVFYQIIGFRQEQRGDVTVLQVVQV